MPILTDNQDNIKKYNEFVRSSPYSRAMQDRNWQHVKKGWDGHYVYLEENGKLTAALSILSINAVDGRKLFYANRGPVCDFSDIALVKKLIDEAKPLIDEYKPFLLRIDPEYKYDENLVGAYRKSGFVLRSRETNIHSFTQPRFNMVMNNIKGKSKEEVFDSISPKTRYNIRLSERKGVYTKYFETNDKGSLNKAIDIFYELTKIMAERNKITHRPKDYFVRLFEAFPKSRVYISYFEEEPLSAALSIPYNKKLFYMYGASSNSKRNKMPNYQMQWEIIKWAIDLGMEEYDFGGVFNLSNDDGLYRFKNGFVKDIGATEYIGELDIIYDRELYQKFINR